MEKSIEYYMDLPYTIVVKKEKDNKGEDCYISRLLEIPHVLGDGKTPQEAMECLNMHMRMAIKAYLRDGIPIAEPQTEYSGNINIRVDPELHANLAREAAVYDISLNKYTALILERRKIGMQPTSANRLVRGKRSSAGMRK
ncbi:MAG: toxin-antitoxin system HicB family antitoxin [Chloroflexi bacterium]|nr:toxin-antitoxin system HicB family antitoxin [Chloroflexota bacterium]